MSSARDAGADFVKTSTGFGDGPATLEAVDIMYRTVGSDMKIKAAGGIKTRETAKPSSAARPILPRVKKHFVFD